MSREDKKFEGAPGIGLLKTIRLRGEEVNSRVSFDNLIRFRGKFFNYKFRRHGASRTQSLRFFSLTCNDKKKSVCCRAKSKHFGPLVEWLIWNVFVFPKDSRPFYDKTTGVLPYSRRNRKSRIISRLISVLLGPTY